MQHSVQDDMVSAEVARARRAYRGVAAMRLRELGAESGIIDSWQTLDVLPHWCVLEENKLKALQSIAGSIYLLPALQSTIDGAVLTRVNRFIGADTFKVVLNLDLPPLPVVKLEKDLSVEKQIMMCGAAVFAATIPREIVKLYKPLLGKPYAPINPAVAEKIYLLATDVRQKSDTKTG